MKYVTLFGSSLPVQGEGQYTVAYEIGQKIAMAGFGVCTGGNMGVMEAASRGARDAGGSALGITVAAFPSHNAFLTDRIECKTLFERINKLIDIGDAYIILQGGTGTMLELAAVWELINKGLLSEKPVAAHSDLWQGIIPLMENQIRIEKRKTGLIKIFTDHNKLIEFILSKI